MKTTNVLAITITALAFWTITDTKATPIELSIEDAASIKGGLPCPFQQCVSGGTCNVSVTNCVLKPYAAGWVCQGDGQEYCASDSYKQCVFVMSMSSCNGGGGSRGCGDKMKRNCVVNLDLVICNQMDVTNGTCNKDCS